MKLEYLDDISGGGKYPYADPDKLIRLYDFDQSEAQKLIDNIQLEVINRNSSLDLSTIKFIEPLNCNLKFTVSIIDLGINASPNNDFICKLTVQSYYAMIGIMEAFVDKENDLGGYNWLYDPSENKIDLLFSPGGTW